MLNQVQGMDPFQSEVMQHYMKERQRRAKFLAEQMANGLHGPPPPPKAPQGQTNSNANGPRSPQIAQTMSQPQLGANDMYNQSSNQISGNIY